MPTYSYECKLCESGVFERAIPAEEREHQCCRNCGQKLERKYTFTGVVWAPTAGGYR